jgi:hypothetical protein
MAVPLAEGSRELTMFKATIATRRISILLITDDEGLDALGDYEVLAHWTQQDRRTAARCRP